MKRDAIAILGFVGIIQILCGLGELILGRYGLAQFFTVVGIIMFVTAVLLTPHGRFPK